MRGFPQFNFPAFHTAAYTLRRQGHVVFSPAERDQDKHGKDFGKNAVLGELTETPEFNLRDALHDDLSWITRQADALLMLKGWEKSYGAKAEHATAVALGLRIDYE